MSRDPVSVLIADDQRLVREGIASLLSLYDDIRIATCVADGKAAVEAARSYKPEVALLDIRMPGMDGIRAAEIMLKEKTAGAVIMLTTFDDRDYILKALSTGVSGYLLKDLPPEEIREAIHRVRAGGFHSTRQIMGKLKGTTLLKQDSVDSGNPVPRKSPEPNIPEGSGDNGRFQRKALAGLTDRERDVLILIGRGLTNGEIAQELKLSEGTVKNYVTAILDTMGFRNRIQAALFAAGAYPRN